MSALSPESVGKNFRFLLDCIVNLQAQVAAQAELTRYLAATLPEAGVEIAKLDAQIANRTAHHREDACWPLGTQIQSLPG